MHLDTIFNIISKNEVLLLDMSTVSKTKDLRRKVTIFEQQEDKKYKIVEKGTDFEQFLLHEGYKVCKVKHEDQLEYIINFLNLGNNTLLAVNKKL